MQETKDWTTQTPMKTDGELRCSGRVAVPAPHVAPIKWDKKVSNALSIYILQCCAIILFVR